jgi:hypothetical protein
MSRSSAKICNHAAIEQIRAAQTASFAGIARLEAPYPARWAMLPALWAALPGGAVSAPGKVAAQRFIRLFGRRFRAGPFRPREKWRVSA